MSCNYIYGNNGQLENIVTDEGKESILYKNALKSNTKEGALTIWNVSRTESFKEEVTNNLKNNKNNEPKLKTVLSYILSKNTTEPLTAQETFNVKQSLIGTEYNDAHELAIKLKEALLVPTKQSLKNLNLYNDVEINDILKDNVLRVQVLETAQKIINTNTEITQNIEVNKDYVTVNTQERDSFGKYKMNNPNILEAEIIQEFGGIKDENEFDSAVQNSEIEAVKTIKKPDNSKNKATTKMVAEYLKSKLGQAINILSENEMLAELKKRGFDNLQAMSQPRQLDKTYYSNAQEALTNLKDKNPKNIKGWISQLTDVQKNGGIKNVNQELEWIGFEDYLNDYVKENTPKAGNISSSVVEDYIKSNQIEIVEVNKGGDFKGVTYQDIDRTELIPNDKYGGYYVYYKNGFIDKVYGVESIDEAMSQSVRENNFAESDSIEPTKYEVYQLKGAENYREVLLTMPNKRTNITEVQKILEEASLGNLSYNSQEVKNAQKTIDKYNSENKEQYKSSHWDEANILAHVRLNEKTLPDGRRVLVVNEIQSDWAQDGRKKGFKSLLTTNEEFGYKELPEGYSTTRRPSDGKILLFKNDEQVKDFDNRDEVISWLEEQGIQQMPYKNTDQWTSLVTRRVLQMATQEGYDGVAFATGQQSADMYSLSQQVDKIDITPQGEIKAVYILMKNNADDAVFINREGIITESTNGAYNGKKAEEVLGKDLTRKILETEEETTLQGEGLEFGGEGMKTFYDKIVTKVAQKEAQRFDKSAKLETIDFSESVNRDRIKKLNKEISTLKGELEMNSDVMSDDDINRIEKEIKDIEDEKTKFSPKKLALGVQPYIAITDKMKSELSNKGIPLFSAKPLGTQDKVYGFYDQLSKEIFLNESLMSSNVLIHETFHAFEGAIDQASSKGDKTAITLLKELDRVIDESKLFNEQQTREDYRQSKINKNTNSNGLDVDPMIVSKTKTQNVLSKIGIGITNGGFINKATGEVYLNDNVEDTALHKINGQIYLDWLSNNKKEHYDAGIELLNKNKVEVQTYIDKITVLNPELQVGSQEWNNKLLSMVIEDQGEQLIGENKKGSIKEWLDALWGYISKALGLSEYTAEQVSKMTLAEFGQVANVDILKGNVRDNLNRALEVLGNTIPALQGIRLSETPIVNETPAAVLHSRKMREPYKKALGESVANAIVQSLAISLDESINPQKLIDFIKTTLPIESTRAELIESESGFLQKVFEKLENISEAQKEKVTLRPEDLLRKVKYDINVETDYDKSRLKYLGYYKNYKNDQDNGEAICTLYNGGSRFKNSYVTFFVKDNAEQTPHVNDLTQDNLTKEWEVYLEQKGRKNEDGSFDLKNLEPNNLDPYSISVMSVQIAKEGKTLKSISRYNHTLLRPDHNYTNLDNIVDNLHDSFYNLFNVIQPKGTKSDITDGNILDGKGRLFKVAKEYDGINWGDGFYIKANGKTVILDSTKQRIVDGFIINSDGTIDDILNDENSKLPFKSDIVKSIEFKKGNKIILNAVVDGKNGVIEISTSNGQIKEIYSDILTSVGDYSLRNNSALTTINMPLVTSVGDNSLRDNSALTTINLPLATNLGDNSLRNNSALFELTKNKTIEEDVINNTSEIQIKIELAIKGWFIKKLQELSIDTINLDNLSLNEVQVKFTNELTNHLYNEQSNTLSKDTSRVSFSTGNNDIRFMILGEKGANNLDRLEEATLRTDNLKVAEKSEKADRKDQLLEEELNFSSKKPTNKISQAYAPRQNETEDEYVKRMRREVAANLLGENSEEYFEKIAKENNLTDKEKKSFINRVKDFIKSFSDWIAKQIGFEGLTPEEASKLTTKDVLDKITTTILKGQYKNSLFEDLSQFNRITVMENVDGKLTAKKDNKVAQTIASTLQDDENGAVRATLLDLEGLSPKVWKSTPQAVKTLLKNIESKAINISLDFKGLADKYDVKSQDEIVELLRGLHFLLDNTTQQNLDNFIEIYEEFFDVVKDDEVAVEKVEERFRNLPLIKLETKDTDYKVFKELGLIKVGTNTYIKTDALKKTLAEVDVFMGANKITLSEDEMQDKIFAEDVSGAEYDVDTLKKLINYRKYFGAENIKKETVEVKVPQIDFNAQKQLLAPNGKPSNLTPQQYAQVRTPAFLAWFGDWINDPENSSKVVDENGEPLVVYHFTEDSFNIFNRELLGSKTKQEDIGIHASSLLGFWFNTNNNFYKSIKEDYAIQKVFLGIRDEKKIKTLSNLWSTLQRLSEDTSETYNDNGEDFLDDVDYKSSAEIVEMYLEEYVGYEDGIKIENDTEFGGTSYVVFEPNQIKSAENNNGEFSLSSNNINFMVKSAKELKTDFISEVRKEQLQNLNNKALQNLEFSDKGITVKNTDPISIQELNTYLEENQDLKNYLLLNKNTDFELSRIDQNNNNNNIVSERDLIANGKIIEEFKDNFRKINSETIQAETEKQFIRIGKDTFERVTNNLFAKLEINESNFYQTNVEKSVLNVNPKDYISQKTAPKVEIKNKYSQKESEELDRELDCGK